MTELLKQAEALGWYESDVCDDWIVLSPIKEKDNLFIKTTIYIEWGALAPKIMRSKRLLGLTFGTRQSQFQKISLKS